MSSLQTLPNSVKILAEAAFSDSDIIQLDCGSVEHIESGVFQHMSLTTIILPSTVTYIGEYCFSYNSNLTDIYCEWYEGDVEGAPWGASNTTRIHYLGEEESSSSDESSSSEMSSSSNESSSSDESSSSSNPLRLYDSFAGGSMLFTEYDDNACPVINTGIHMLPSDPWEWEVTYAHIGTYSGIVPVMGGSYDSDDTNFAIWVDNSVSTNNVEFVFGDETNSNLVVTATVSDVSEFHTYRMSFSTRQAWIDGTLVGQASESFSSLSEMPLAIMGFVSENDNTISGHGAISECKIYYNNSLVWNFIPCRCLPYNVSDYYGGGIYKYGLYDLNGHIGTTIDDVNVPLFEISSNTTEVCHNVETEFVFDAKAGQMELTMHCGSPKANSISIDWGDGNITTTGSSIDETVTHEYSSTGEYNVTIVSPYTCTLCLGSGPYEEGYAEEIIELVSFKGNYVPKNFINYQSKLEMNNNVLGDDVYVIDKYAFEGCESLAISSLPSNVYYIGYGAFAGCTGITSIILPSSLTYLGGAFSDTGITSITLPDTLKTIGDQCFSGTRITSVTIPSSIEYFGEYIFGRCEDLVSVTLPNNIGELPEGIFSGCTSLVSITLPDSISAIRPSVFRDCTNLVSVNIPYNVSFLASYAFENCTSLVSINLPSHINNIGDYCFNGCTGLTSLTLPSSLKITSTYCFKGCTGLTECTFLGTPNTSGLSNKTFTGCTNLVTIRVPWAQNAIKLAPWGATNATIIYNYVPPSSSSSGS